MKARPDLLFSSILAILSNLPEHLAKLTREMQLSVNIVFLILEQVRDALDVCLLLLGVSLQVRAGCQDRWTPDGQPG
jgi:hypothetical protein